MMLSKAKRWFLCGVAALSVAVAFPTEAFAQRSSGGGRSPSKSSSPSRSSPSKSTPAASQPKKNTPAATPNSGGSKPSATPSAGGSSSRQPSSGGGTATKTTTAPKLSAADQALYQKAKQQGTSFSSRDQAATSFRQKYASEYTSKFASEPAARPSYIPPTYSSGGVTHNVVYNQSAGGYGFWSGAAVGAGTFMLYDAFSDAATMNAMMNQRGYYYGPAPTAAFAGPSAGTVLLIVGGVIAVILLLVIVTAWSNRPRRNERFASSGHDDSNDNSLGSSSSSGSYSGGNNAPVSPKAQEVAESKEVRAMGEVGNIAFWRDLPLGTVVTLTDQSALEMSQAAGRGLSGMEYTVDEVLSIDEINNLARWILVNLIQPDGNKLSLLIKSVGDALDIRAMYVPESMQPGGNRADMVQSDHGFIFNAYEAGTPYQQLTYANEFPWSFNWDDIGEQTVNFAKKGNLEFSGRAFYDPPRFGGDALLATVAEYQATSDCREPEIAIIEVGKHDIEEGGFIMFLVGNAISVEEVNVMVNA